MLFLIFIALALPLAAACLAVGYRIGYRQGRARFIRAAVAFMDQQEQPHA